jgi:acetyl-CoA C-acetyltransferase
MGAATDRYQRSLGISRSEQDEFAARSHQLAGAAAARGRFDAEIVPVEVPGRLGTTIVSRDEGIRPDPSLESLAALPPAFAADGTITAGNSSQLSDGGAALVLADRDEATRRGLTPMAEIMAYGSVAGPDPALLLQPARAIERALSRAGLQRKDLDLVEINEAFASVGIASARELDIPIDRINVNGGAIALGHPVGMSGARLLLTLVQELRERGGGIGAAALCGGGGQGDAIVVRVD